MLESCDDLLTAEEACEIPKQAIVEYVKAQAKLN